MPFLEPDPPVVYRPLMVSIVGWFLAIGGLMGPFSVLLLYASRPAVEMWETMGLDPRLVVGASVSTALVQGVAGIAMLKRIAWGRTLYLVYTPLAIIAGAILIHPPIGASSIVGGAVTYGLILFVLTRPGVNGFFDGTIIERPPAIADRARHRKGEANRSDLARVFGVIVGVLGGFLLFPAPVILGMRRTFANEVPEAYGPLGLAAFVVMGVAAVVLLIGTLLWGRRRWRAYWGWILVPVGLEFLIGNATLGAMANNPSFLEQTLKGASMDPARMAQFADAMGGMLESFGIWGAGMLLLGAPLLWYQYSRDRMAVEDQ
jgi:hypothetical protein